MKFRANEIVSFGSTRLGRERAAEFAAEYPEAARVLSEKEPHRVKLLEDFELRPAGGKAARGAQVVRLGSLMKAVVLLVAWVLVWVPSGLAAGVGAGSGPAVSGGQFEISGFQISDWPALLIAELTTGSKMLDGSIGAAVVLITWHFTIRRYIREQAGTPEEPKQTEIIGQPLKMQAVRECVQHEELNLRLEGYVTTEALHDTEKRLDAKIEENFRELDNKRSASIGNLHEHLKGTERKLGDKISEEVGGTHERINQLAGNLGEVKGALSQVTTQLSDVIRLLMAKGGKGS